jgi:hypothetical protein
MSNGEIAKNNTGNKTQRLRTRWYVFGALVFGICAGFVQQLQFAEAFQFKDALMIAAGSIIGSALLAAVIALFVRFVVRITKGMSRDYAYYFARIFFMLAIITFLYHAQVG